MSVGERIQKELIEIHRASGEIAARRKALPLLAREAQQEDRINRAKSVADLTGKAAKAKMAQQQLAQVGEPAPRLEIPGADTPIQVDRPEPAAATNAAVAVRSVLNPDFQTGASGAQGQGAPGPQPAAGGATVGGIPQVVTGQQTTTRDADPLFQMLTGGPQANKARQIFGALAASQVGARPGSTTTTNIIGPDPAAVEALDQNTTAIAMSRARMERGEATGQNDFVNSVRSAQDQFKDNPVLFQRALKGGLTQSREIRARLDEVDRQTAFEVGTNLMVEGVRNQASLQRVASAVTTGTVGEVSAALASLPELASARNKRLETDVLTTRLRKEEALADVAEAERDKNQNTYAGRIGITPGPNDLDLNQSLTQLRGTVGKTRTGSSEFTPADLATAAIAQDGIFKNTLQIVMPDEGGFMGGDATKILTASEVADIVEAMAWVDGERTLDPEGKGGSDAATTERKRAQMRALLRKTGFEVDDEDNINVPDDVDVLTKNALALMQQARVGHRAAEHATGAQILPEQFFGGLAQSAVTSEDFRQPEPQTTPQPAASPLQTGQAAGQAIRGGASQAPRLLAGTARGLQEAMRSATMAGAGLVLGLAGKTPEDLEADRQAARESQRQQNEAVLRRLGLR